MTFEEAQKTLTEYADSLEEMKVYIHRDLKTLPKVYVDTVQDYLTAVAKNIKHRNLVEEFELNYEKARGALFDCVHERDKIKAELDQFTLDVDKELEKLEAVKMWFNELPVYTVSHLCTVLVPFEDETVSQERTLYTVLKDILGVEA